MLTSKKANEYLAWLVQDNLMKRLRSAESDLIKRYQARAASDLAVKILSAPDFIYAAAMMRQEAVFFGRGDFQNILEVLKTQKSPAYKDIGNKLAVIKQACLYKKGIQADINDPESGGREMHEAGAVNAADQLAIYSDAKNRKYFKHPINYKHVF